MENISPPTLEFSDQHAFRPSGSTTTALIALLQKITNLLDSNAYVSVVALDYRKAFDTVRHSCLMEKLVQMDLPDNIYNWLTNFFCGHSHCTRHESRTSDLIEINASIIQGSAIGPAFICRSRSSSTKFQNRQLSAEVRG